MASPKNKLARRVKNPGPSNLTKRLKSLDPHIFENLVFDLVSKMGLRNCEWRTPGADGGRDIQGDLFDVDFSGAHSKKKWYVECKRYAKSVDWPTVHEKAAYAVAQSADYLLMATSATFSTRCLDEINNWNSSRHNPQIRAWAGHDLSTKLSGHPDLLIKYDLSSDPLIETPGFFDLATAVARTTLSAHGRAAVGSISDAPELQLAASLAELLVARMQQFSSNGRVSPIKFSTKTDAYSWVVFKATNYLIDRHAFRAFLCFLRLHQPTASIVVQPQVDQSISISFSFSRAPTATELSTLSLISQWGFFKYKIKATEIELNEVGQ